MFVDVALDIGTFVYRVPKVIESKIEIGSLVQVPLKKRKINGWVVEKREVCNFADIKEILGIGSPNLFISQPLIELGKWMASYYHASLGFILNLMVPNVGARLAPVQREREIRGQKSEETSFLYKSKSKSRLPLIISEPLSQKRFKSVLLYGTNRRGIYLQTIDAVLSYGRGAIFLVPEIKLTNEIFSIFKKRFGPLVALLHSGLKKDERWAEWLRVKQGEALVVVGTMSAVFAPVHNLGIIIIDEEQDTSYKNEKQPRFSTPVVGKKRAELESCLYICGSATPSIETFYDTETKKSTLVRLVSPVSYKEQANIFVVDMRKEADPVFSDLLKAKLKHYIANHQKILLFLNRRGFSSFILCEDCGYIPKCPNCGISLTYHRSELALKCHYCGYYERAIGYCSQCSGTNLSYKGVGTARVEEVFNKLFPGTNIFRLDLDSVSSKYTTHIFNSFIKGEITVLLGTQLVAKPIDFPQVGLVGIISADIGLNLPDFRTTERTFSLLMRLAKKGKETVIQTYNPGHRVLKYLNSYDNFYKSEILLRKEHNYPPFSHLIRILIETTTEAQAKSRMDKIGAHLHKLGVNFLGPCPCPFEYKKGKFRTHLLLKVQTPTTLNIALPSGSIVEVDPINFL